MKHKFSTFCKVASFVTMANVIAVTLLCHTVFAVEESEVKDRSLYFKVFNQAEILQMDLGANKIVGVTCDTYDDHPILIDGGEILPPAELLPLQHDMILGVSVICPAHSDAHFESSIHIDGDEEEYNGVWPITDASDGYFDDFHASATCVDAEGMYSNLLPKRIVLECLDHDAIISEEKTK